MNGLRVAFPKVPEGMVVENLTVIILVRDKAGGVYRALEDGTWLDDPRAAELYTAFGRLCDAPTLPDDPAVPLLVASIPESPKYAYPGPRGNRIALAPFPGELDVLICGAVLRTADGQMFREHNDGWVTIPAELTRGAELQ